MALKQEFEQEVVFIVADVDDPEGQRLARDFQVRSIPAFFYIDRDGLVIAEDAGLQGKGYLEEKIKQIIR